MRSGLLDVESVLGPFWRLLEQHFSSCTVNSAHIVADGQQNRLRAYCTTLDLSCVLFPTFGRVFAIESWAGF